MRFLVFLSGVVLWAVIWYRLGYGAGRQDEHVTPWY
jgi:hypothetical protein